MTSSGLRAPHGARDGEQPAWEPLDRRLVALLAVPAGLLGAAGALTLVLTGLPSWAAAGLLLAPPALAAAAAQAVRSVTGFRLTRGRLEVRRGVLVRRRRSLALERLRSVDIEADLLQRLAGVATVRLGTGQHDGGDLRLQPLRRARADALRTELLDRRGPGPEHEDGRAESSLAHSRPSWLRFAPLTLSLVLGGAGAAVGVASQVLDGLGERGTDLVERLGGEGGLLPTWSLVALTALAALALGMAASAAQLVEAWWRLRLTREATGALHVSRGLLTSRSLTVDAERLRGVELAEPLLLRLAGGARLKAMAVGVRATQQAPDRTALLPPAPRAEAWRTALAVMDRDEAPPLVPHPAAARGRREVWALGGVAAGALLVGLVGLLTGARGLLVAAAAVLGGGLPAALVLAADASRSLGHGLDPVLLAARSGTWVRRTALLERDGVLGLRVRQSPGQRRRGLATLVATTAAGRGAVAVRDLDAREAVALAEELVPGLLAPLRDGSGR